MNSNLKENSNNEYVRNLVRNYMKSIRLNIAKGKRNKFNFSNEVIYTEARKGFLNGKYIDRLAIFMRGAGCSQVKEVGGCTFCGFYNATNLGEKISDKDYIEQIKNTISNKKINFSKYGIVCLYNDGSLLCEKEINFNAVISIIDILNNIESVKKIVIESRIENITKEKLTRIRQSTNKEFDIAVGFESANPLVRDLCINKSFDSSTFEEKIMICNENNINLTPLLMAKPPFLTEKEAIEDFVNSLQYRNQFNIKRIDMELPTVEENTLTYNMWIKNMYTPLKLWSVVEILKKKEELGLKIPVHVSPMNYSVSAKAKASNCDYCDNHMIKLFEEYNEHGDVSIFDKVNCTCKQKWEKLLITEAPNKNLPQHIEKVILKLMEDVKALKIID